MIRSIKEGLVDEEEASDDEFGNNSLIISRLKQDQVHHLKLNEFYPY